MSTRTFATQSGWKVVKVDDPEFHPVVLMLTVDPPTQPDVWRLWLPKTSKILVNAKNWEPAGKEKDTFQKIAGNITKTDWGTYTLVEAHQALLTQALETFPNASHYVLVSGDAAPVKPYKEFVNFMHQHKNQTLMTAHTVQRDTINKVLEDAMDKTDIDIGTFWGGLLTKKGKKIIHSTAPSSAICNKDANRLVQAKPSMTTVAFQFDNICDAIGSFKKVVAADEVAVHSILEFGGESKIRYDDMSPTWLTTLETDGAHADVHNYQDALKGGAARPNWLFARKVKPIEDKTTAKIVQDDLKLSETPKWTPPAADVQVLGPAYIRSNSKRQRVDGYAAAFCDA